MLFISSQSCEYAFANILIASCVWFANVRLIDITIDIFDNTPILLVLVVGTFPADG